MRRPQVSAATSRYLSTFFFRPVVTNISKSHGRAWRLDNGRILPGLAREPASMQSAQRALNSFPGNMQQKIFPVNPTTPVHYLNRRHCDSHVCLQPLSATVILAVSRHNAARAHWSSVCSPSTYHNGRAPPNLSNMCAPNGLQRRGIQSHSLISLLPFMKDGRVPLFVDNEFVPSLSDMSQQKGAHLIHCPSTSDLIAVCPQSTSEEIGHAIKSARAAFPWWSRMALKDRRRYLFKFINCLRSARDDLVTIVSREQGKTLLDARGDVDRGIEAVEETAGASALLLGDTMNEVADGVDCATYKLPLGVCAGIAPFNFPAMIPLWMFPLACLVGNTFLLKPSERTPLATMRIMSCVREADWPRGVVNVVHGDERTSKQLCLDKRIEAVSFVGSTRAGEEVYALCAQAGKRALCNMGAKNHVVIMPDAEKDRALRGVVNAAFRVAGQRCMAASAVVLVAEAGRWFDDLLLRASAMRAGPGYDPEVDVGPMISLEAKNRVKEAVRQSIKEGAKLVLDGLHPVVESHPKGYFLAPTILEIPHLDITAYKEELFGPVLCVLRVETLRDAVNIINSNPYGNGTAIYSNNGNDARLFQQLVNVGQVGINVAVPVPNANFSFTGWKNSARGPLHLNGRMGVEFFTKTKTITSLWKREQQEAWIYDEAAAAAAADALSSSSSSAAAAAAPS